MFVILTVAVVSLVIFCVGIGVASTRRGYIAPNVPMRRAVRLMRPALERRVPS